MDILMKLKDKENPNLNFKYKKICKLIKFKLGVIKFNKTHSKRYNSSIVDN